MLLDEMRSLQVRRHEVFWKVYDGRVVILRVLHQRRNSDALVFADESEQ